MDKFSWPAEMTKTYREANYKQLNEYAGTLLMKNRKEREERFAPDTSSPESFRQSIENYRVQFLRQLGYITPEPIQSPDICETLLGEEDDISFSRVMFRVAQGLDCYGILTIPKNGGPYPLCVLLHGAGGSPEMVSGITTTANYYNAGRVLARRGWAVFAPLTLFRPFIDGDASTIPGDARSHLDTLFSACGTSLSAIEIFKISRCIDVLPMRGGILPGRAAIAGLSFGGYYTLMSAAVDPRFELIYSSCFFSDLLTLFYKNLNWIGLREFIQPSSALHFACAEVAMLCCPRRLIIENGQGDELFGIEDVRREVPRVMSLYKSMGLEDRFHYVEHGGGHEFGLSQALEYFKFPD